MNHKKELLWSLWVELQHMDSGVQELGVSGRSCTTRTVSSWRTLIKTRLDEGLLKPEPQIP